MTLAGSIALYGIWWTVTAFSQEAAFERHFGFAMPESVDWLHYASKRSGFSDMDHVFAFHDPDLALCNQVLVNWKLTAGGRKGSSGKLARRQSWWPTVERLQRMSEYHERVDEAEERYYHLWADQNDNLVYINYGNW